MKIEAQSSRWASQQIFLTNEMDLLKKDRNNIISEINSYNKNQWDRTSDQDRKQIQARILSVLSQPNGLTPKGKLRAAIYAVASIPDENEKLNEALRNAIVQYPQFSPFKPGGQIWGVAINPYNGRQAAIGDDQGIVRLGDPFASEFVASTQLTAATDIVNGLAFSPNGELLAAAYRAYGAVVWNLMTREQRCSLGLRMREQHAADSASGAVAVVPYRIYSVAFAPDGKTLAVGGSDRTARLWDLSHPECPQLPQVFHHDDEVFGVAFSSDGQKLATASGDGTFAVWNVDKSLKPLRKFEIGKAVFSVAFSPVSNALIAASGDDGTYGVWNIENGNQIQQFPALTGQLGQIAFSPDGRFVATGGTDGTAILADVSSGHVDKLDADQPLFGLAFTPDSQYLLTGSLDGTARLWIIGKNEVLPASRRGTLLTLGLGRLGADINLTMAECMAIREMHIQILDVIERDWPEAEKNTICAIPALVSY